MGQATSKEQGVPGLASREPREAFFWFALSAPMNSSGGFEGSTEEVAVVEAAAPFLLVDCGPLGVDCITFVCFDSPLAATLDPGTGVTGGVGRWYLFSERGVITAIWGGSADWLLAHPLLVTCCLI